MNFSNKNIIILRFYKRKERRERKKDEREKPLLTKGKRQKVVRFLISPKKKKVKIEVNERK